MIFVNLPVSDLAASMRFYEAIGFTNNPQFTSEQAAAMMWSDEIVVMLLQHEFWKTFTSKTIPDAHRSAQVMLAISQDSREAVDAIVQRAREAGGGIEPVPTQDLGFMYNRSFEDLDGHIWEAAHMDMSAAEQAAIQHAGT
jgi:predicted lactoylglutathione lyase